MAKLNVEMSKSLSSKDASRALFSKSTTPNRGIYCVAKSIADSIWYRAKVVDLLKTGRTMEEAGGRMEVVSGACFGVD